MLEQEYIDITHLEKFSKQKNILKMVNIRNAVTTMMKAAILLKKLSEQTTVSKSHMNIIMMPSGKISLFPMITKR